MLASDKLVHRACTARQMSRYCVIGGEDLCLYAFGADT